LLETKVSERTRELQTAQEALSEARDDLELKVQNRTAELHREMAEREQIRKELQATEAKLRGFIDGSEDAIAVRGLDRRLILWNEAFARGVKSNCGVDVHVGMRAEDYVSEELYARYTEQRKSLSRALEGESAQAEYVFPCPDGQVRYFSVRWTPVREEGELVALAEVTRDITEQKLTQENLSKAEEKYRTVAEFTYDWEYWEGPDRTLLYISPSCERITGYTPSEFLDNPELLNEIVISDDTSIWNDHRREVSRRGASHEIQFRIRKKDGAIRWIEHAHQSVRGEEGTFLGFRVSNRDITRRRHAEEEVSRLQNEYLHIARVSAMGELTAALAHELKQPLAAIRSNAQAAQRFMNADAPDFDELREILADIVRDNRRADEVIGRLRTLMRKSNQQLTKVNINDAIKEVFPLVSSYEIMKNISLEFDLDDFIEPVSADRVQLQQVTLNLILNSSEALMSADRRSRRIVVQTSRNEPQYITVSVEDNGIGIDEQTLDRLFDPFYTTKREGMGMGLPISRSIIEAHGGKMWAENNPDSGATFFFTVPTHKDAG
jgi:PAS domain S-box-containing protein